MTSIPLAVELSPSTTHGLIFFSGKCLTAGNQTRCHIIVTLDQTVSVTDSEPYGMGMIIPGISQTLRC